MKKILYISAILLAALSTASCSVKDFLTREPINKFSAETYFRTEAELEMYANGMVNSWLPDYTEVAGGDAYNDLIATKTSTDFFRADVIWGVDKQTGWSASNWGFLRRVNYMLTNMDRAKGNVSEAVYNHYEGVGRFWRAYCYFSKVTTFSNVPWVEKYLQPDDVDILYGPRDDREYVFHKMVEDLTFACENCDANLEDSRSRVNKWLANAFAARVFLYEATFRLNVPYNPSTGEAWKNNYETPQRLLELSAACSKAVIEGGKFKLSSDYPALFLSNDLNKDEVIWGRHFSSDLNGRHSYTRYFHSSTLGQQYSATKDLIHHFMNADGTAITDEQERLSINKEFEGRDPRLGYTVLGPGHQIELSGVKANEQMDFTFTKTGYQIVKWSIPDDSHFQNSLDENSIPIIRYAEVLLMYAEAMNELGQMDADVWNMTVGALRKRAGVVNTGLPTASDAWLKSYYTSGLKNQHITEGNEAVALEIRRERVAELTFESGLRQADLYRYGQCDLVKRRSIADLGGWRGLYLTADEVANGFTFEGAKYTIGDASKGAKNTTTCYPVKSNADAVNTDWFLTEGDHGFLVYKYALQWSDKMYVRPIPQTALTMNEKLGQNYGW
ncbi:MAG: RagB/SusD family nutrient uptake outer membrane protein [Bacteroidales bacterium]|nr:RagB/SusD family nutrient uptake outer membrane protein [Bacteroidales bacterium]